MLFNKKRTNSKIRKRQRIDDLRERIDNVDSIVKMLSNEGRLDKDSKLILSGAVALMKEDFNSLEKEIL